MENNWEFFENLQELIFVIDMENHTMAYMNHSARNAFGCPDHKEYQNRKCYEFFRVFRHHVRFVRIPFLQWAGSMTGNTPIL